MNGRKSRSRQLKDASLPSSGHLIKMYMHNSQNMQEVKLRENMTSKNKSVYPILPPKPSLICDVHIVSKMPNKDICTGPQYEDFPGITNHTVRKSHYDSATYSDSEVQCQVMTRLVFLLYNLLTLYFKSLKILWYTGQRFCLRKAVPFSHLNSVSVLQFINKSHSTLFKTSHQTNYLNICQQGLAVSLKNKIPFFFLTSIKRTKCSKTLYASFLAWSIYQNLIQNFIFVDS